MPELPDVEVFRQYFQSTSLNQQIVSVEVLDNQILEGLNPDEFSTAITDGQFVTTRRHGKHFFARVEDQPWLAVHFGMTGFFEYSQKRSDISNHPRLVFSFGNGNYLAYDCQRKLGEVQLVQTPDTFVREQNLGPDVYSDSFTLAEFSEILSGTRAMIKSALMSQDKMAGVGNIYSDEVLFQSGIHPRMTSSHLSENQLETIFDQLKTVLSSAIEAEVDPAQMPDDFLLPHRQSGENCPKCGQDIHRVKVSGRSSYYCPNCQVLSEDN